VAHALVTSLIRSSADASVCSLSAVTVTGLQVNFFQSHRPLVRPPLGAQGADAKHNFSDQMNDGVSNRSMTYSSTRSRDESADQQIKGDVLAQVS